jgi:hypothetical protein
MKSQARQLPGGACCSRRPQNPHASPSSSTCDALKHLIRSASVVGLDEASNPAKEFGALSFCIVFRVARLRGQKFSDVAFGPDQGANRLGPPFGVRRLAAGQRLVRLVQQAPQPRFAIHSRLVSRTQHLDRAEKLCANRPGRIVFFKSLSNPGIALGRAWIQGGAIRVSLARIRPHL